MIDELQLGTLINKCKHLKYKFAGVYAADNFPLNLKNDNFIIVNSDKATQLGITGSCFATETTSFYSLTHLDLHSTITRMYVIDYLLQI